MRFNWPLNSLDFRPLKRKDISKIDNFDFFGHFLPVEKQTYIDFAIKLAVSTGQDWKKKKKNGQIFVFQDIFSI